MSETPNGRFCWFELLTVDPDAAQAFYGKVTGWEACGWGEGAPPYTMWTNREIPLGGLMQLPEEASSMGVPSHWLIYLSTPDADATSAKAKELGGEVLKQLDIPEVGRIAIIRDPQGAVFAAFQPSGETPGHDGPSEVGEVSWRELMTTSWEDAWTFYSELFGWQKADQMDMGDMGIYQMYSRGAHPLGGMMNRPPDMPVSAWLMYVRVPDVHAAVETVKANGGQLLNGPMEVPGGDWVAQCLDPQGAAFAVHHLAAT